MQTETDVGLRNLIADESRTAQERELAAAHLVRLLGSAEIRVADTDPDVLEAMRPWTIESDFDLRLATEWADLTEGRSLHGRSLQAAKDYVIGQRRAKERAAAVRDAGLDILIRLAYCDLILESYTRDETFHRNNPTKLSVFRHITSTPA